MQFLIISTVPCFKFLEEKAKNENKRVPTFFGQLITYNFMKEAIFVGGKAC